MKRVNKDSERVIKRVTERTEAKMSEKKKREREREREERESK